MTGLLPGAGPGSRQRPQTEGYAPGVFTAAEHAEGSAAGRKQGGRGRFAAGLPPLGAAAAKSLSMFVVDGGPAAGSDFLRDHAVPEPPNPTHDNENLTKLPLTLSPERWAKRGWV